MDDPDKEDFWEACQSLKPDYRRDAFDRHWAEFLELKERAAKLKADGIEIHPTFGLLSAQAPQTKE